MTTNITTLVAAFQNSAATHADRIALRLYRGEEITWRDYADRVRAVAAGLAALGVGRGDTVALMLANRPEACIVDMAALHAGATPFSVYNTSAPAQLEYLLGHADTRVLVTEADFVAQVLEAKPALPKLEHVFVVNGAADGALPLTHLIALGEKHTDFDFEASWRSVTPDDVAVLIYTSGTTGAPKAVQLTHHNLVSEWDMTREWYGLGTAGEYVSYLPMAHLADRQVGYYPGVFTGSTVTLFPDARQAIPALAEIRPTFLATVPRMWEKFKVAIEIKLAQEADDTRRAATQTALDAAIRRVKLEMTGEPVPTELVETLRVSEPIFAGLRAALGMDRVEVLLSGGAPIAEEVLEFFMALGLPILELWGMSETSATVTSNHKHGMRIGTVGRVLPGQEIKLADDGELLVRGPNVMIGYRNDPEKTAEAIDADGWLYTGDIGEIDTDGYVRIVDRKKELIINAAGKNMSPTNIENQLKAASSLIGNPVAIGDRRPFNTALIVLDPEAAVEFARINGLPDASIEALAADPLVHKTVTAAVERANAQLSRVETIKRFTILPVEWAPDSEELTPTLKLKRRPIAEKYAAQIEAMYS